MAHHREHRLKIRPVRVTDAIERQASVLRASPILYISQPAPARTLQENRRICL